MCPDPTAVPWMRMTGTGNSGVGTQVGSLKGPVTGRSEDSCTVDPRFCASTESRDMRTTGTEDSCTPVPVEWPMLEPRSREETSCSADSPGTRGRLDAWAAGSDGVAASAVASRNAAVLLMLQF